MLTLTTFFSPNTRNLEFASIAMGVFGAVFLIVHGEADWYALQYYGEPIFERFAVILHREVWAIAFSIQVIGHLVAIVLGPMGRWLRVLFCATALGFWLTLLHIMWSIPFFDAVCSGMVISMAWATFAQSVVEKVEFD